MADPDRVPLSCVWQATARPGIAPAVLGVLSVRVRYSAQFQAARYACQTQLGAGVHCRTEPQPRTDIIRAPIIPEDEVTFTAIRAQGAGGQNVNKVSNAVHLRFDIRASSLPEPIKERLLRLNDQRITKEGEIIIKAQAHRSLEKNREEALQRLQALVESVATPPRVRRPTRPTLGSQRRRLEEKTGRGQVKALRTKVRDA